MPGNSDFLHILQRLAPGTRLRDSFSRIIQHGNGALIVLGSDPTVDAICSGGFVLDNASFSVARLAELAKMDGAIVVSDDGEHICRANVHLIPDPSMATTETGSRHRTAERTAKQTGKPVISISEDRSVATLFYGEEKHELESPTVLTAKVNQSLASLERFRRRLDHAEERMTRLEVADMMTNRWVITVLQRAELVTRIGHQVERDSVGLGGEGTLVMVQLSDLLAGVEELRQLVTADYALRRKGASKMLTALEAIPTKDIHDARRVADALGLDDPDEAARPRGLRILSHVPRLPDTVADAIVKRFSELPRLMGASVDDLNKVPGVGPTRALQVRRFLDRIIERSELLDPATGD